jgi:hypothetical protein
MVADCTQGTVRLGKGRAVEWRDDVSTRGESSGQQHLMALLQHIEGWYRSRYAVRRGYGEGAMPFSPSYWPATCVDATV